VLLLMESHLVNSGNEEAVEPVTRESPRLACEPSGIATLLGNAASSPGGHDEYQGGQPERRLARFSDSKPVAAAQLPWSLCEFNRNPLQRTTSPPRDQCVVIVRCVSPRPIITDRLVELLDFE
jgi:hypothetical protein